MSKIEITIGGMSQGSLAVDGHDIADAITGFSLQTRVGCVPLLQVDLMAEATHLTGKADVRMKDSVYELLCLAGWTPPDSRDRIELPAPDSSASQPMPVGEETAE